MATATCQLSEDQFLCSICLDVFTDPVTLPCGHNFCKKCIDQHWSFDATCKCPFCKHVYHTKPDVKVNIFISELAAQFRQSQISTSVQQAPNVDEIFCDFCADPKMKALRSCLFCRASYCESHLEKHLTMAILKRHTLVKPQRFLESKVEGPQQRPDAEIEMMIAVRQQKVQQLCQFMELNNKDANSEISKSVQAFTALKDCVERDLDILIQELTKKRKTTEDKAKGYIRVLEGEISDLKKGVKSAKDWANFSVHRPTYEGIAVRAMAQLDEKLSQQMNTAFLAELQRVQKEKVYVMLDPEKVHPKSANQSDTKGNSDSKPECRCVLASQSFSSGKFYFEVDVRSRSKWALGLAKELHVNREVALTPRNTYWIICMRNKNEWYAGSEPSVRLSLKSHPQKVGVFVDYEEGLVSFYDADKAALIYTFADCDFPQKVHPFFSPCANNGVEIHTKPESSCVLQ